MYYHIKCSLITVHNLFTISHTMCVHTGGPKKLGDVGGPPLVIGGMAAP